VGLVEAIAGELGHQFEDAVRLLFRHGVPGGALDEARLLDVHLLLLLLAHGAAQKVGLPEAVAGQDLGDLHHLFLVDDDPVGLGQHLFQRGVQIVDLGPAEFAVDIGVDHLHRPGPVEGDQGGDLLDGAAAHLAQGVAHALGFQLEHPDRLARGHQLIGRLVVERELVPDRFGPASRQVVARPVQRRQGLEAEEVELDQPRRLDPLHVELAGRDGGARVLIQGHQLDQRPVADDDAGGVGRGVAIEALQLQRRLQQVPDRRFGVARLLEARLQIDGLGQGHRIGRVVGHHLAEPVDLAQRHLQHPADVAQHGPRLQGAEGNDLGDPVLAVLAWT
jgi:hypothetical protein